MKRMSVVIVCLYALGCGGAGRDSQTLPTCTTNGDCANGYVCILEQCLQAVPQCAVDADCGDGERCSSDGVCFVEGTAGCTADTDCTNGQVCINSLCSTIAPHPDCGTDADCGTGQTCNLADGKCYALATPDPDCTNNDDCASGQVCIDSLCSLIAPTPDCVTDTDCGTGKKCLAGTCVVTPPTGGGAVGAMCTADTACTDGTCISQLPGGYCTQSGCDSVGCPAESTCFPFQSGQSFCLRDCAGSTDCLNNAHICDVDNVCWPGEEQPDPPPPTTGTGSVGSACQSDTDCKDPGAQCYPYTLNGQVTGFVNGYCLVNGCTSDASCPAGSTCEPIYQGGSGACVASCSATTDCRNTEGYMCGTLQGGAGPLCWPGCGQDSTCPNGYGCEGGICMPACTDTSCGPNKVCGPDGLCVDPPCSPGSCGGGMICNTTSGLCVPDLAGGPGAGPGPTCNNLPQKDCTGGASYCGQLLPFEPAEGTGYVNYPLNGETWTNQYRSYARRDLQMLIQWATAFVDCKSQGWGGGNGYPLGLGDMSESNGAIPGTSDGSPGHPAGTHVNGFDMDIAYYQNSGPNNYLKAICEHTSGGVDQYHCTTPPHLMDVWRNSLFLGALMSSNRTRVIGVDGQVGALAMQAMEVLCADGWLDAYACQAKDYLLAYEVTNTGKGWYNFHHHHLHISLKAWGAKPGMPVDTEQCLVAGCPDMQSSWNAADHKQIPGHSCVEPTLFDDLKPVEGPYSE
jgi:hypothetical protein